MKINDEEQKNESAIQSVSQNVCNLPLQQLKKIINFSYKLWVFGNSCQNLRKPRYKS